MCGHHFKIYRSIYWSTSATKWLKTCSGGTSWVMAFRTWEVQPLLLQNAWKSVCREVMWRHSDCCTPSNWDSYKQCYLWLLPSSSSPEAVVTGPKEMDRPPSGSMEQSAVIFSQLHPLERSDVSTALPASGKVFIVPPQKVLPLTSQEVITSSNSPHWNNSPSMHPFLSRWSRLQFLFSGVSRGFQLRHRETNSQSHSHLLTFNLMLLIVVLKEEVPRKKPMQTHENVKHKGPSWESNPWPAIMSSSFLPSIFPPLKRYFKVSLIRTAAHLHVR